MTENAIITIKLLIFFFHIFSDVAIGPKFTKLKLNIVDCYVILLILTFNYYKEARNPAIDRSGRSLYLYTIPLSRIQAKNTYKM